LKKLDLGRTLGILANIGVIAGIVFLGFELRQNNELLIAQSSYAQFNTERERRMVVIENANGISELLVKDLSGAALTEAETFRVNLFHNDTLDMFRWQFREFQEGRLPDDFIDLRTWHDVWDATPGLREQFQEDIPRLDPEFVRFVQKHVINR